MNYIVLNGIKSTSVNGLLIQSLPPITKPLMRTQIDVIDGRDGDLITPLGYSAYDKELSIGLHGNFNINAVISYFTSSGSVIFSNEPDKVYKYTIYEQIDFEKLIRFKTATVKLHVQPFKHSATDAVVNANYQLIDFADAIKTEDGVTAAISDGVISVSGTAAAATEIYMPILALSAAAGEYILRAFASGTGAENVKLRLITAAPADAFGGGEITLVNGEVGSISGTLAAAATYNYLYFAVAAGTCNFTLNVQFTAADPVPLLISNNGNTVSKPRITVYGCGSVSLYLNGSQILIMEIGADGYITIDVAALDAYNGITLKNRSVTGDYNALSLPVGINTITATGMVTRISVTDYSRWV